MLDHPVGLYDAVLEPLSPLSSPLEKQEHREQTALKPITTLSSPLKPTNEWIEQAKNLAIGALDLDDLKEKLLHFDGIGLKQTARHCIFGNGHTDSPDLMIIGDRPHDQDERTGQAFSGLDGQFIDQALKSLKFSRDPDIIATGTKTVYSSFIVNWRPPGNQDPSDNECALSLPFIHRHIALIKPKRILICGRIAARLLLSKDMTLTKWRENWFSYEYDSVRIPVRVTHTPLHLLEMPACKRDFWIDMVKICYAHAPPPKKIKN
jgi:DNA polymerase